MAITSTAMPTNSVAPSASTAPATKLPVSAVKVAAK